MLPMPASDFRIWTAPNPYSRNLPSLVYELDLGGQESAPKPLKEWTHEAGAYFFIRFDNRNYPVARSKSRVDLATLTRSRAFKDGKYLQLPQGASHTDLLTLYFYLNYDGLYPPSFRNLVGTGPPQILPYKTDAPLNLQILVSAFFLGKVLEYPKFVQHCLDGLYKLSTTNDDPVEALDRIYNGSRLRETGSFEGGQNPTIQNQELRNWAKQWLGTKPLESTRKMTLRACESNLEVIRQNEDWNNRFSRLLQESAALREDLFMIETTSTQTPQNFDVRHLHIQQPLRGSTLADARSQTPSMYPNQDTGLPYLQSSLMPEGPQQILVQPVFLPATDWPWYGNINNPTCPENMEAQGIHRQQMQHPLLHGAPRLPSSIPNIGY